MHAELVIEGGPRAGDRYVIRLGQRQVIGRGGGVAIDLDDDTISRRHAEVRLEPDGFLYLRDLSSRNGTRYQGRRLARKEEVRLEPGALLELGRRVVARVVMSQELALDPAASLAQELLPADEFEALGVLGRGALGLVYSVRQRLLDRTVAVKLLHLEDDGRRERIVRAARLTQRIKSPYVVEVFDVRILRGHLCVMMELVNGPNLQDRLEAGRLPLPVAATLGENVAQALVEAHQEGVIHRDVKPANIILSPEGIAKLMDFGIAVDINDRDELGQVDMRGSLAYSAPELLQSPVRAEPRTDVYALAATLYHAITGRPALAATLAERRAALDARPGDVRERVPECPFALSELLREALDPDPERRPQAKAFADRLTRIRRRAYPQHVVPDPGRRTQSADETVRDPNRTRGD